MNSTAGLVVASILHRRIEIQRARLDLLREEGPTNRSMPRRLEDRRSRPRRIARPRPHAPRRPPSVPTYPASPGAHQSEEATSTRISVQRFIFCLSQISPCKLFISLIFTPLSKNYNKNCFGKLMKYRNFWHHYICILSNKFYLKTEVALLVN